VKRGWREGREKYLRENDGNRDFRKGREKRLERRKV
jgi:hypothetical protein